MNKFIFRLAFGGSLTLIVCLAGAQRGGGGGGSHSSGGGGGGGSHYSGGSSSGVSGGSHFGSGYSGGYSRYSGSPGYGGGYHSSGPSGFSGYRSGGYSGYSHYGGATSASRYSGYGASSSYRGTSGAYHDSSRAGSSGSQSYASRTSPGGTFSQSHASESRSGTNSYSGDHNLNTGAQHESPSVSIGSAPQGRLGPSSAVGRVIGNGGRDGRGGWGGWRHGYWGYGGWRDGFFAFPFYVFDPFLFGCFVSPWYYYPCLPPYVAAPNVIVEPNDPYAGWSGGNYDWAPESSASANPVLDDSVQDLVQSFEADDHKAIDRVTPHSGNVRIFTDGKYSYSMKANDFYDTYVDGIESTKTDRYEVMDVKMGRDGNTARVVAKHIYNDPSGKRTSVYHSYLLVKEGNEYVIREFGTSEQNRIG